MVGPETLNLFIQVRVLVCQPEFRGFMSNKKNIARELVRREKRIAETTERACNFKVRHTNILSAISHCVSLRKKHKHGNPIMAYHCEFCGFGHVGHLGSKEGYLMYGGESVDIRKLQR